MTPLLVRLLVIAACLGLWFWTQALIARRPFPAGRLGDRIHDWTAGLNRALHAHPARANALLVVTSGVIDGVGIYLLGSSLVGPSFRPFLGLLMLFALRQLCQGLCALPPPDGMIWRHPGFPSLLVTYGTPNDLFFSGHTAIAVYGALEIARAFGPWGVVAGVAIAVGEAATVLVLRAHYTMDVFAGAVAAAWVFGVVGMVAPWADRVLAVVAR